MDNMKGHGRFDFLKNKTQAVMCQLLSFLCFFNASLKMLRYAILKLQPIGSHFERVGPLSGVNFVNKEHPAPTIMPSSGEAKAQLRPSLKEVSDV
jgi:hypothetical protein